MDSLYKIQSSNPSVIYPGHGPVLNDPMTTIHTYITHRQAREKQVIASFCHNWSKLSNLFYNLT